jgi:hypothetical protein
MYLRVFGLQESAIEPVEVLEWANAAGLPVTGHFRGDEAGWFACELVFTDRDESPILLDRYLAQRDDIRDDLNTWAAWLETADYSDQHQRLMEHVIAVKQLFTLRRPFDHADEIRLDRLCVGLAQWLAQRTEGVYQIDHKGFFAADGTLLLTEY